MAAAERIGVMENKVVRRLAVSSIARLDALVAIVIAFAVLGK
jgi:hypothetical protein